MTEISRRLVLGSVAGGAAASLLPPSLHTAMAQPVRRGGLRAIEHVIVLMQENRSFDHYYGTLRGIRGYGDRQPLRLRDGKSIFHQPKTGGGEVLQFSLRKAAADAGRNPDDIQYLGALAHGYSDATQAWAGGWNDDWVQAKTAATMTHYDRRDIPLQYELAETFTICDAYHCSVNGSTNPNRNYLWSGTTGYEPGTTQRAVTNAAYSYDHKGYDWTAYPERLEAAGVSWQIYQEWDNFTDNAVEYFKTFKDIGHRILENRRVTVDGRRSRELAGLRPYVRAAVPRTLDRCPGAEHQLLAADGHRWHPTPPVDQALPVQEPGRRPARALPYGPSVSGSVADGKLMLALSNNGSQSAHFAIYPYGGELPAPTHLDVRRGDTPAVLTMPVDGPFELAVQGPNRFWAEVAG